MFWVLVLILCSFFKYLKNYLEQDIFAVFLSVFLLVVCFLEAAVQMCSTEKVFWKYASNLQENTHDEVQSKFI